MEPGDPIERLLRLLVQRERLGNTLASGWRERVRRLFERTERLLRDIDPPGAKRSRYKRERTERLLAELQREFGTFAPEFEREVRGELAAIGRQQAVVARQSLIATLGTVNAEGLNLQVGVTEQRIRAILNTDPFRGRTLKEHAQTWSATQYNRTRDQIRLGMSAEESMDDIVRRVRGDFVGWKSDTTGKMRKTGGPGAHRVYRGGTLSRAESDIESVVRTAVTHVSSVGMLETFEANKSVVSGTEYVATLDSDTTPLCLSLDGTVWPLDSTEILVPGRDTHYNCRSVLVPVIDWEGLGLEPPEDGFRAARDLSEFSEDDLDKRPKTRGRGKATQIPSSVKAQEWLRSQPVAVQDRVLGKGRADLFRRGEVSLRDLIRDDNTVIPLNELLGG